MDHQGIVDSIVTNDYLVVDNDIYFPCVGVDSSCAQFSILDLYELDSTQAKSVTSVRGRLAKCTSEWEGINARGFILEVI